MKLVEVAAHCREIIARADAAGVALDSGNIIDLLADNLPEESLRTLQDALVVSGHGARFPHATRRRL